MKIGAETLTDDAQIEADDEGWRLVKHFKLHLHPDTMKRQHNLTLDGLNIFNCWMNLPLIYVSSKIFQLHVALLSWRSMSILCGTFSRTPNNFLRRTFCRVKKNGGGTLHQWMLSLHIQMVGVSMNKTFFAEQLLLLDMQRRKMPYHRSNLWAKQRLPFIFPSSNWI